MRRTRLRALLRLVGDKSVTKRVFDDEMVSYMQILLILFQP